MEGVVISRLSAQPKGNLEGGREGGREMSPREMGKKDESDPVSLNPFPFRYEVQSHCDE